MVIVVIGKLSEVHTNLGRACLCGTEQDIDNRKTALRTNFIRA